MRRLATYVHVHDGEGNPRVFGPDDEVPAEVAKLITNPSAWQSDEPAESGDSTTTRTGRRRSTS
ncbi:hypothetical protein [Nocardia sp. NPDC057440]|uniref:hypothetical protein n=1 Tax=Nocardia sp. NPDC057440 TaxID=3346134 RepID=UPI003670E7FE